MRLGGTDDLLVEGGVQNHSQVLVAISLRLESGQLRGTNKFASDLVYAGFLGGLNVNRGDFVNQIGPHRQFSMTLRVDSRIADDVGGHAVALEVGLRF